jgi:hypothetical protein
MSKQINQINDQLLDKLGAYLMGRVNCEQYDLSRLEDNTLLLVYNFGHIGSGLVNQIRGELRAELLRRGIRTKYRS